LFTYNFCHIFGLPRKETSDGQLVVTLDIVWKIESLFANWKGVALIQLIALIALILTSILTLLLIHILPAFN